MTCSKMDSRGFFSIKINTRAKLGFSNIFTVQITAYIHKMTKACKSNLINYNKIVPTKSQYPIKKTSTTKMFKSQDM